MTKWVTLPTLAVVLLALVQAGFSYYRTEQARAFVESIDGTYTGEIHFYEDTERDVHADIYVNWKYQTATPPSCPVTLISILEHESGLALTDSETGMISSTEFKAVHKSKNGHTSIEPIYSLDTAHAMKTHPGEWEYILVFKFHCSIVNSEWISFIKFDKAFQTKPVKIYIEDNNETE